MRKNEFRIPLMQSGAILLAIILIFALIPSSDPAGFGSFFGALLQLILFAIGLTFALAFSIAVLVGIFIGAIALHSQEHALSIYEDLREKLIDIRQQLAAKATYKKATKYVTGISEKKYDQVKNDTSPLPDKNSQLLGDVSSLQAQNEQLQLEIQGLSKMVEELQQSEVKNNELLADLTAKAEQKPDTSIKVQIQQLEDISRKTSDNLTDLADRLEALESGKDQSQSQQAGLLSYIEDQADQELVTKQLQDAISQELTYAQIDEFLTKNLSSELDTIIKDHPSLTKDYIRNLR